MKAMPTTVAIADDHPVVLRGLASLIGASREFDVIAVASNGREIISAVQKKRPDIVIVDLSMPEMSGLQVISAIRRQGLSSRTILLTAMASDEDLYDGREIGADGIIFKEAAPDKILECLRQVRDGRKWFSHDTLRGPITREAERRDKWKKLSAGLTARELEIVRLVVRDSANRKIATSIGIAEGTLKVHLNNIYRKLEVVNRKDLILLAAGSRKQNL